MCFCLGDFLKDTQALYQTPTLSTRNLCGENKKCLITAPNVIFPIPGNYSICFHMQYSRFTLLISIPFWSFTPTQKTFEQTVNLIKFPKVYRQPAFYWSVYSLRDYQVQPLGAERYFSLYFFYCIILSVLKYQFQKSKNTHIFWLFKPFLILVSGLVNTRLE